MTHKKSEKQRAYMKKYMRSYAKTEKQKAYRRAYAKTERYKAYRREYMRAYNTSPERKAKLAAWASAHRKERKIYLAVYRRKHRAETRARVAVYAAQPERKFAALCKGAKERGLRVDLSFVQYVFLTGQTCTYCQSPLPAMGHGLDRKNSALGYSVDNCCACCASCNRIRGKDDITHEEWLVLAQELKKLRARS